MRIEKLSSIVNSREYRERKKERQQLKNNEK